LVRVRVPETLALALRVVAVVVWLLLVLPDLSSALLVPL
jgi:hypothetical protein